MPSMGVGTSDGEEERPARSQPPPPPPRTRAVPLTRERAAVEIQHWFRCQQQVRQSRHLLAFLILARASNTNNNRRRGVDEMPSCARGLRLRWPQDPACERLPARVLECVLDGAQDYVAAVDVENFTRRLVCEESLPATNAAWREASSSARQHMRRQHPLLRRVTFLPEKLKDDFLAQLQGQMDAVAAEVRDTDGSSESGATQSWLEVEASVTSLFGAAAAEWLATRAEETAEDALSRALVHWRHTHTRSVHEEAAEDTTLVRDVPPLPPARAFSTSAAPAPAPASAPEVRPSDASADDWRPTSLQTLATTRPDSVKVPDDAALDAETWLREDDDMDEDDGAEGQADLALKACNARFYAAQEAKHAALQHALVQRLGLDSTTDDADATDATDATPHAMGAVEPKTASDAAPRRTAARLFGEAVDQVRVPCLGVARTAAAVVGSSSSSSAGVCAMCELNGVWPPEPAPQGELEDALVTCTRCGAAVHVACASTSSQGAPYCSSVCASRA